MRQDQLSVDELFERLDAATRELNASPSQAERAWELVKERGSIVRELAERGARVRFSEGELARLGEAIREGEQARQSLAVRREAAREQARELRATRRVQSEFQPYRQTSGGQVAVDV